MWLSYVGLGKLEEYLREGNNELVVLNLLGVNKDIFKVVPTFRIADCKGNTLYKSGEKRGWTTD
jgi:hypothetical protein